MSKTITACLIASAVTGALVFGGVKSFQLTEVEATEQIAVDAEGTTVVCQFAYRPSTRQAKMVQKKVTIDIPVSNGDEIALAIPPKIVEFDQFRVEVRYQPSSLVIHVYDKENKRALSSHLYQLGKKVRNQFSGGHGFTGLAYIHHPDGEAELQYWAEAK